jgi:anaerobic sulfite reductase subunit B
VTTAASGEVRAGPQDAMAPLEYTVAHRRTETRDTATLTLAPARGPRLALFRPGQFTMLSVAGVGEIPVSISGAERFDGRIMHTVRDVGAVSGALCRVPVGGPVGVRGPYGRGWDLRSALGGDLLVMAGGIGLAPLRSLVLTALALRGRFGRIVVLVGARTSAEILYPLQVAAWARRRDLEVESTVDHATPGWTGSEGLITEPLARTRLAPERTTAFLCGPEAMMKASAAALLERGLAPARIQVSLERNMQCGIGWCGHCQLGPYLLCRQGPVHRWDAVADLLDIEEL